VSGPIEPVRVVLVGAGNRGARYGNWIAAHPRRARVVAVAEPRSDYRDIAAATHGISGGQLFTDWRDVLGGPRTADLAVICTTDGDHVEPACALAEAGYDILLEKPIAPTEAECERVVETCRRAGVLLAVCHVMRYMPYTRALKEILASGAIGDIISVEHLEPIGFSHFAHSYVRGNWRDTAASSSMLLAKSCHDLDWLRHVVGSECRSVSSYGSLKYFKESAAPANSAARCIDCAVESTCSYSAPRYYYGILSRKGVSWPLTVLTPEPDEQTLEKALREGPYGRCVYRCDNDVVDHQIVAMEFEGGVTVSFTVTAFTEQRPRQTRIFGTEGELTGDGSRISVFSFGTGQTKVVDVEATNDGVITSGHGGGDDGLMDAVVAAVATGDPGLVETSGADALASHRLVFAAERARLERRVIDIEPTASPAGAR
jgi:predicted dehydrogenase